VHQPRLTPPTVTKPCVQPALLNVVVLEELAVKIAARRLKRVWRYASPDCAPRLHLIDVDVRGLSYPDSCKDSVICGHYERVPVLW
jgi:hypothetical protein